MIKPNPRLKTPNPAAPSKTKVKLDETIKNESISSDALVRNMQRDIILLKRSLRQLETTVAELQSKINSKK